MLITKEFVYFCLLTLAGLVLVEYFLGAQLLLAIDLDLSGIAHAHRVGVVTAEAWQFDVVGVTGMCTRII